MNYPTNFDLKKNPESLLNKQFFTVMHLHYNKILILVKCHLLGLSKYVRFFAEREIRKIHISCPHRQGYGCALEPLVLDIVEPRTTDA